MRHANYSLIIHSVTQRRTTTAAFGALRLATARHVLGTIHVLRNALTIAENASSRCTRSSFLADIQLPKCLGKLYCHATSGRHPNLILSLRDSYQLEQLPSVKCAKQVRKPLPDCEHSAMMPCHRDPATVSCREPCTGALECCSKSCKASCGDCQALNLEAEWGQGGKIVRTHHVPHPCERPMYCQHNCGLPCSREHECNTKCKAPCRQQCVHHSCPKPCSEPCAPCMEPCIWSCAHFSCPVLCGSVSCICSVDADRRPADAFCLFQICSRLPCDEPCTKKLRCGHTCPSGKPYHYIIKHRLILDTSLWRALRCSEVHCVPPAEQEGGHRRLHHATTARGDRPGVF